MFFFNTTKISRSKLKHKDLRWRSSCVVRVRSICPRPTMKPKLSARRNLGGNLFTIANSITGIYHIGKSSGDFHIHQHTLHCQYHEAEVQLSHWMKAYPGKKLTVPTKPTKI